MQLAVATRTHLALHQQQRQAQARPRLHLHPTMETAARPIQLPHLRVSHLTPSSWHMRF